MRGERFDAWNRGQIYAEDAMEVSAQIEVHLVVSWFAAQFPSRHNFSARSASGGELLEQLLDLAVAGGDSLRMLTIGRQRLAQGKQVLRR